MNFSSKLIEDAVKAFRSLPGIGNKTALRLVLHMLNQDDEYTKQFTTSLTKMKEGLQWCESCGNISDAPKCSICTDPARDQSLVCIVENIRDVMAIEETAQFRGLYHVLGGVISPIDGIGPESLNIGTLIDRVKQGIVKEVIMAISPTIEGETTIFYLSKQMSGSNVRVSTIARGVAFGGELQYTDEITLGRSIVARVPYQTQEG